ncbi:MAG: preprotein translocase subunit SecA [Legionella sp.]|nr:MAG: preprotein translocase subunit SecA [Legionella sp.]
MTGCYCGSGACYALCCQPYHHSLQTAQTPEILMRSRYAAYASANIDYIKTTMTGQASDGFDPVSATLWSQRVLWISLHVIRSEMIAATHGTVEFIACFVDGKSVQYMHELSEFRFIEGHWYYVDGVSLSSEKEYTITRNMLCPCKSQKKWKHCHGR